MRKGVAALLSVLALGAGARGQANVESQTPGGVSLKVEMPKRAFAVGEDLAFTVTFQNEGAGEIYLYGGMALGRKRMWSALGCSVTDEKRREIPITLYWGVAVIAGRLDPFAQHLKAGESYALNVTRKDYLFFDYRPAGVDRLERNLPAGAYTLRCAYKTRPRGNHSTLAVWDGDTFAQLWERRPEFVPKVWEGGAASNEYDFNVGPQRDKSGHEGRRLP